MVREVGMPTDLVIKIYQFLSNSWSKRRQDHLLGWRKGKRNLSGGKKVGKT